MRRLGTVRAAQVVPVTRPDNSVRQLLEETDLSVDEVADRCGFGAATTLRGHFARRFGTSPQSYRRTFRTREPVTAA